jgi:hypothetical protein
VVRRCKGRVGNFKTLLLEMKIEKDSRAILAVILPVYGKMIDKDWPATLRFRFRLSSKVGLEPKA